MKEAAQLAKQMSQRVSTQDEDHNTARTIFLWPFLEKPIIRIVRMVHDDDDDDKTMTVTVTLQDLSGRQTGRKPPYFLFSRKGKRSPNDTKEIRQTEE